MTLHEKIMKRNLKVIFIFSILFISFTLVFINQSNSATSENCNDVLDARIMSDEISDDFDVLKFWEKEIRRVNSVPLNIRYGGHEILEYTNPYIKKEFRFTSLSIYFDSPNWFGKTPSIITLHGYLLYPEEIKNKNPGVLCMHGLFGSAKNAFNLAYPYLEKGFIVLCHSHPGHGKSEGGLPSPENFYYEGEYRESAHFYLTLCGAIQGLRVLESLGSVERSKMMVTGSSYGALSTMWLSGICGDRIAGAVPYIAMGDLEKVAEDPTKLFFYVLGKSAEEIPDSYKKNQYLRIDPTFYLKSSKTPPIFWQFGTNDEFFHHHSINKTYDSVRHGFKALQIYPNAHHGFPGFENTTKFFIDYIINNGPAFPKIHVKENSKEFGILGSTLNIEVDILSSVRVESVQVCFRYLDIVGSSWEKFDLEKDGSSAWTGVLYSGVVTSEVDYYIIVNIRGKENIWFSSKIYTPGAFVSNSTALFYGLFVLLIVFPAIVIIRKRYKRQVLDLDPSMQSEARKCLLVEFGLLGTAEVIFYVSLLLPWVIIGNGVVTWNHIYLFNNLFTMSVIADTFSLFVPLMFLIGWILYTHLSFLKPMISSLCKIIYPIFFLSIFGIIISSSDFFDPSSEAANFGSVFLGIGYYLMLFSSISIFLIGIWKRKYQFKIGIRESKKKNIKKELI